jgi:hypothetical protein
MNTLKAICYVWGLCCWITGESVYAEFTNWVQLRDDVYLSLTHDSVSADARAQEALSPKLSPEARILAKLSTTGNGRSPVRVPYGFPAFVVDLYDSKSNAVTRTLAGVSNNIPPPKVISVAGAVRLKMRHFEPGPGGVALYDLGCLRDFFQFPGPGTFIVEVRMRHWYRTNSGAAWVLSEPVRLPVVATNGEPATRH